MTRSLTIFVACTLLASACQRNAADKRGSGSRRDDYAEVAPEQTNALSEFYDAKGNLKSSNESYGGLSLPRGLTPFRQSGRLQVYHSELPAKKFIEYFSPRLFTGDIENTERGAAFRDALVRSSDPDDPKRVNVSVLEIGEQRVRVSIEILGPSGALAPTLDEVRIKMRKDQNRLY